MIPLHHRKLTWKNCLNNYLKISRIVVALTSTRQANQNTIHMWLCLILTYFYEYLYIVIYIYNFISTINYIVILWMKHKFAKYNTIPLHFSGILFSVTGLNFYGLVLILRWHQENFDCAILISIRECNHIKYLYYQYLRGMMRFLIDIIHPKLHGAESLR